MPYSDDAALLSTLPQASSYIASYLTASTEFSRHRQWASNYIDNLIKGRVSVPVSTGTDALLASGLSEVEAYLTAYRLIRQNFSDRFDDVSRDFYMQYKKDADEMLNRMYFPASYDTPTQLHTFTGNGTITVSVYDQFTYTADWIIKCVNTDNPSFSVWNNRRGVIGYYDLSADAEFPAEDVQQGASEQGLPKEINIVLATGATAFALGDTWAFRTYGRYRIGRKRGFGSIRIERE